MTESNAHAIIIEGPAGDERAAYVTEYVASLNCESQGKRPCGTCPSCIQIAAGTSMDVFHMSRSRKTGYGVNDDVLPFIDRLSMGAYGRHIIGIIDEADVLSEICQNKLLKTLEEPEEGAVIILAVTNRDNLLPTVLSRCVVVRMNQGYDDEETSAAEEYTEEIRDLAENLAGKICRNNTLRFCEFRNAADKKISGREGAIDFLNCFEELCRDRMIEGTDRAGMIRAVELAEKARTDICREMDASRALRRLYLELQQEDTW